MLGINDIFILTISIKCFYYVCSFLHDYNMYRELQLLLNYPFAWILVENNEYTIHETLNGKLKTRIYCLFINNSTTEVIFPFLKLVQFNSIQALEL